MLFIREGGVIEDLIPVVLSSSLFFLSEVSAVSVCGESLRVVFLQVSHGDLVFVDRLPNSELIGEDV